MSNPHSAEVKEILSAYPPNHPDFKDWNCCYGNDETPKQHTMDCIYRAVVCLDGLQTDLDRHKDLLRKQCNRSQELQTLLDEAVKVIEKQCEEMQVFLNVSLKCHFPDARAVQDEAREFLDMVNLNKAVNEKLSGDILSTISRLEYLRLDVEALNVAPREVLMSCIAHWAEKAMGKRLNMIGGE